MHRLGDFPDLTIDQARSKASELNVAIAYGKQPVPGKRPATAQPTFGDLFTWYLDEHAKEHKRSWKQDEERFRNHLQGLAKCKLTAITKADVRQLHVKIGADSGKYAANKMLFLVRAVFNYAAANDRWDGPNPALGITPYQEQSRDRRLNPNEMPAFMKAVGEESNADVRDFVLLGLFTGARKTNLLEMQWGQLDLEGKTWRILRTKNGTPQTIPLNALALDILRDRHRTGTSPWVFPGTGVTGHMKDPRKGWMRILAAAGITDLHIRDLRRAIEAMTEA